MNCLECRRLMLAAPRERTDEQQTHISECGACLRLASELAALDRKLINATRLPVPEGLAERIVLAGECRRGFPRAAFAAAAVLLIALSAVTLLPSVLESHEPTLAADAVGPAHPAVAAISMVVDEEPRLLRHAASPNRAVIEARLKFVGLALRNEDVSVRYAGTCRIRGRDCDHLVLSTPDGHVSVFLTPHEHPSGRVLVADRRMAALLSPAPSGAYIVVAQSADAARRAQKLFVNG